MTGEVNARSVNEATPLIAGQNYGMHRTADAVAVTALDGREHLVPDYALAEGWRGDGLYPAWCGMWVAGASMCEPPGKPCDLCAAQTTRARPCEAAHRRAGFLPFNGLPSLTGRHGTRAGKGTRT